MKNKDFPLKTAAEAALLWIKWQKQRLSTDGAVDNLCFCHFSVDK